MRSSVIDDKYFFSVQKNIVAEIEHRRNRKNGTPSMIGYGAVSASIYKKSTSDIESIYDTSLAQLVALNHNKSKEETMFGTNWFDDDFFKQKEIKQPSSEKKLENIIQGIKKRKSLVTSTEKDIKKHKVVLENKVAHPFVQQYYDELKQNHTFGLIGVLPIAYTSNAVKFPPTIAQFLNTTEGDMLQKFCKRYIK
jgi:hypothetical protein